MSKKNKKYELGGKIIKALKGKKESKDKAVWGTVIPLAIQALSAGVNSAQNIAAEYKEQNALNMQEDINPYAKYGTELGNKDYQNYKGAKHAQGGIDIGSDGSLGGDAVEVEGGESRYKDYVYSDALPNIMDLNKTYSESSKALIKKYKNADFDLSEKAALDIEMKKLGELNTLHRKSMEEAQRGQEKTKAAYGWELDTDPTKINLDIYPRLEPFPTMNPGLESIGSTLKPIKPMGAAHPSMEYKNTSNTPMGTSMYKMGMKKELEFDTKNVFDKYDYKGRIAKGIQFPGTSIDPNNSEVTPWDSEAAPLTRKDKIKSFFKVLNRDLGEITGEAAKAAPDYIQSINNALQAMEKPMTESPILPNYSRARDYMDRGSIDFSEGENTISRMSNAARETIRNSVRSTPISQALQANADTNAMAQMSQLKQQEEAARAQQAGGYAQMEGNMANAEAQALYQNRVDNQGNRAASRNMRNAAVTAFMQDRNTVMQRENERELNIFNNKQVAEVFKSVAPDMKNELIGIVDKVSKAKTKAERDAAYAGLDEATIKLVDEAVQVHKAQVEKNKKN